MEKYTIIKNYLLNHIDVIGEIVSEINCLDGSLDFLEYWNNDEEFFNTYFYNNPMEAVRSSFYGDYKFCDKYVKFNGYGNLESFNDYDLEKEYKEYLDEITKALLEHYQEINISDKELIKLIDEIK